jgi:hypothetical protein
VTPTEAFWNVLREFRDDTLIIQIILTIAASISVWLILFRPGKRTDSFTKIFLSFAFAWNGVACFIIYCGKSMIAKFLGGPLYLVIAFLFLIDLFFTKKTEFSFPDKGWRRNMPLFFITLALLFPVLGILTGHGFIALPMYPCPLAGFTLALLCAALPRTDKTICTLTLIWAFVNIPKCFGHVNCYEEITLVLTGFYGLFVLKIDSSH